MILPAALALAGMGFMGCGSEKICTDPEHHGVKIEFRAKDVGDDKLYYVTTDKCLKCQGDGCNKDFLEQLPKGSGTGEYNRI